MVPYARVSTVLQEHPDAQIAELRRVGQARGWVFVGAGGAIDGEPFIESASGADRSRPQLAAAMALIKSGHANALASVSLDRVTRSLAHLLQLVDELQAYRAELICTRDGELDTTTPTGKAFIHIRGVMAELERALSVERSREYAKIRIAEGKPHGRPNSLPSDALVMAVALRQGQHSWRAIVRQLVAAGFPAFDHSLVAKQVRPVLKAAAGHAA